MMVKYSERMEIEQLYRIVPINRKINSNIWKAYFKIPIAWINRDVVDAILSSNKNHDVMLSSTHLTIVMDTDFTIPVSSDVNISGDTDVNVSVSDDVNVSGDKGTSDNESKSTMFTNELASSDSKHVGAISDSKHVGGTSESEDVSVVGDGYYNILVAVIKDDIKSKNISGCSKVVEHSSGPEEVVEHSSRPEEEVKHSSRQKTRPMIIIILMKNKNYQDWKKFVSDFPLLSYDQDFIHSIESLLPPRISRTSKCVDVGFCYTSIVNL